MTNNYFVLTILFILAIVPLNGKEILINTCHGESFFLEIDPQERLIDLEEKVSALLEGEEGPFFVAFNLFDVKNWISKQTAHTKGGYLGYPRNYMIDTTSQERDDIRYILLTLANKSILSLAGSKAELEAAGDRIEHLHPLRFLMTIFTDEELKAAIRNVRGKGWVWNQFISGVKEALATENRIGNMKEEYLYHFASSVKIHPQLIFPAIAEREWEKFINLLIQHIPRLGDHDRYDG